jgi:hypothetical protein
LILFGFSKRDIWVQIPPSPTIKLFKKKKKLFLWYDAFPWFHAIMVDVTDPNLILHYDLQLPLLLGLGIMATLP